GTLGVTEGVPVGFKEIRLLFDIDSDATKDQLDQLIELTDRYCVIFQTIQNSPRTRVALNNVRHQ
ncbi:MAG: OsmC family protein, partial [Alphaproteobacteria bacterium]